MPQTLYFSIHFMKSRAWRNGVGKFVAKTFDRVKASGVGRAKEGDTVVRNFINYALCVE